MRIETKAFKWLRQSLDIRVSTAPTIAVFPLNGLLWHDRLELSEICSNCLPKLFRMMNMCKRILDKCLLKWTLRLITVVLPILKVQQNTVNYSLHWVWMISSLVVDELSWSVEGTKTCRSESRNKYCINTWRISFFASNGSYCWECMYIKWLDWYLSWIVQAANMVKNGKEVMLVTSGAIGVGRQRLLQQCKLTQNDPKNLSNPPRFVISACLHLALRPHLAMSRD